MASAQLAPDIPEKGLFRIGEVSRLTETKPFVLRFWESEFPMLQPVKSPSGHRLYRREDIETVIHIKRLLYEEGFTIAGARKHLSQNGVTTIETLPFDLKAAAAAVEISDETVTAEPGVSAAPVACTHQETLLSLKEELAAVLTLLEGE
jgi:DNA-binding transcriptional MerR regulator